jgi:hypothetical protein
LHYRSLRIAGRSSGSGGDTGKSSNTERDITSSTSLKERPGEQPPTLAEVGARLADSAKSATVAAGTGAGYRSRACYLLELDHHVGEDLLESVLGLLRNHGLSCDVAGGSDGDRYILVTASFEVLAAQVCVASIKLTLFLVNFKS